MDQDSSLSTEDKLKLESWGLPKPILQKYAKKGIQSVFPWQLECLTSGNVLNGGNLVFSAPTSAGKTLVAEILALKTVLEKSKKVIIILPFVSVVREKMIYLQSILSDKGVRVEGFMGSYHPPGGFRAVHIAICTIEKANSLINRLLEESCLDDIGCIVVDELHLLGDPHRGYLLELLLTKLRYMCKRDSSLQIQIIGMSATLPNLNTIATWLNATLYCTDFRPVPLSEYVKINNKVYSSPDLNFSHSLCPSFDIKNDPENVIFLCLETILKGFSVVMFCPTKNWCESLAQQISAEIKRIGSQNNEVGTALRSQLNSPGICDVLQQLKRCPVGLENSLGRSVSFGVAYHHAGLTMDERDIIESAFKQNILRVLVATSTLSSGVNLPARRVIIRSPSFQGRCMDIMTYKQMIGRAGRMGQDTEGESYLICTENEKMFGEQLIKSSLPAVESCLGQGSLSNSLKRAILEVIACGLVTSLDEVSQYLSCTLLAASLSDEEIVSKAITTCIAYLEDNEFIKSDADGGITPSALAQACLSASIQPDQALKLLGELNKARKRFVLHTDLHAIYQVTPFSICDQWSIDWMKFFSIWEELPDNVRAIGELVGVEDRFLIKAMRSTLNSEFSHKVSIHKRFYTALALQDLINEVPLNQVASKYGCNKGMLQSLQQSASTFAGMVHNFCKRLGWGGLEVILAQLAQRIQFGVHRDLLDLLRLDCMSSSNARALYNAGITTMQELAISKPQKIENALLKGTPFESKSLDEGKVQKTIWIPGYSAVNEMDAADIFIHEARKFLLKEMGVKTVDWDSSKSDSVHQDSNFTTVTVPNTNNEESFQCQQDSEDSKNDVKKSSIALSLKQKSTEFNNSNINDDRLIDQKTCCRDTPEKFSSNSYPSSNEQRKSINNNHSYSLNTCNQSHILNENVKRLSISDLFDTSDDIKLRLDSFTSNEQEDSIRCSTSNENIKEGSNIIYDANNSIKQRLSVGLNNSGEIIFSEEFPSLSPKNKLLIKNINGSSINSDSGNSPQVVNLKHISAKNSEEILIKSSTPLSRSTTESQLQVKNTNSQSSLMNESIYNSFSVKQSSSATKDLNKSIDIFFDSPILNSSSLTNALVCAIDNNGQVLEEFDSNWGGDSLLQGSFLLEELTEQMSSKNLTNNKPKRKICDVSIEEFSVKKRIRWSTSEFDSGFCNPSGSEQIQLSECIEPKELQKYDFSKINEKFQSYPPEVKSPELFEDSFEINSALGNVLDISNETAPPNKHYTKKEMLHVPINKIPLHGKQLKKECNLQEDNSKLLHTNVDSKLFTQKPLSKDEDCIKEADLVIPTNSQTSSQRKPPQINEQKNKDSMLQGNINEISAVSESFLNVAFESTFQFSNLELNCNSQSRSVTPIICQTLQASGKQEMECRNRNKASDRDIVDNEDDDELIPDSQDIDGFSPFVTLQKTKGNIHINKMIKETSSSKFTENSDGPADKKSIITKDLTNQAGKIVSRVVLGVAPTMSLVAKSKSANLSVVKVCENSVIFDQFEQKLRNEDSIGLSLKVVPNADKNEKPSIGAKILGGKSNRDKEIKLQFCSDDIAIGGVAITWGEDVYYLDMQPSGCRCFSVFKSLLLRPDVIICGYNMKDDVIKVLYKCCELKFDSKIQDPLVADWLLNPEDKSKSLKQLIQENTSKDELPNTSDIQEGAALDAYLTWFIQKKLNNKLKKANLFRIFQGVEMPTQACLAYMELSGMGFSQNRANSLWSLVEKKMHALEEKAFEIAQRKFNLCSKSGLAKVKQFLNITPEKEPQHPLLKTVHNWRKLNSLKVRNLSPLFLHLEDRYHGICCTRTATGRIVMHNPDLQHIPRDFQVGDDVFSLRSAFVPKEGNVLLSADFCQLELRILAHFSKDPTLVSSLCGKEDVFITIGSSWNKIDPKDVTDEIRHQAKQLCYGIIYGMGDLALGEAMGVETVEASEMAAKFKNCYPGLQTFIEKCISECRTTGYTKTLSGRVRYLPDINSQNKSLRRHAERQAVNSMIQGSAADIAKRAMIQIEKGLQKTFPDKLSVLGNSLAVHLILQLHDELVYEVSKENVGVVINIIRNAMESSTKLLVPLPVKVKQGPSWGELETV